MKCNTCRCLGNRWMCTQRKCLGNVDAVKTKQCKPGDVKRMKCNTCRCLGNRWMCTQRKCLGNVVAVKSEQCKLGDVKTTKCTACKCLGKQWICSQRKCSQKDSKIQATRGFKNNDNYSLEKSDFLCVVGAIHYIDDCNYCRCTHREKWKCTNTVCPYNNDHLNFLRRKSDPCTDGFRHEVNACNYCICRSGSMFCTQKPCRSSRMSMTFSEPECLVGDPVPAPDPCNLCICLNSDILCTNNPCIQRELAQSEENCVEGQKYRLPDGCNFCLCQGGEEFCTGRACLVAENAAEPKSEPKSRCKEGSVRSARDKCNVCICRKGKIICTNKDCSGMGLRSQPIDGKLKKPRCVEGSAFKMADGCNICLCHGGQEFCTSRACVSETEVYFKPSSSNAKGARLIKRQLHMETLTEEDCLEGDVTRANDSCNMCVCTQGNNICTNKDCSRKKIRNSERVFSRFRPRHNKKHRMTQGTKQKCVPGKKYLPDDFDPNCPNECICNRNELLCTKRNCFDNWDLNTPFKWPLARIEISNRNPLNLLSQDDVCVEFEPLPSDDICNSCICLHARKVCTVANCDDGDSNDALIKIIQESHGVKPKKKKSTFCEPFTFFSPDSNRFCRNCFCLYNGLALCLLNLCKYSQDIPHQNSPEELDEICTPGEIGYPTKCVTCKCSETAKWICTREELALCQERDCDVKDEFHMGFYPYCAGCKCSVKEWFCSIQGESCKDYSNVTCPLGTFIYNPKQFCSICLCGGNEKGSHNMCFTEAKCVRQVGTQKKKL